VRIDVYHHVQCELGDITGLAAQMESIMASVAELTDLLTEIATKSEDTNVRLDAINAKIDDLRAQIAAGSPVSQAQLDELTALASAAKVSLGAVADDLIDAEQS
jgi:septal ring factor EnvC (AmiA/AmiB activator)